MKFLATLLAMFGIFSFQASADATVDFKAGNVEMNSAIDQAKNTLDIFLRNVIGKNGEADYEASVKVAFDVEGGSVSKEYIWVGPFTTTDQVNFKGVIANEPQYTSAIKFGDEVSFTRSQIADWSIWLTDGKSYGGYTTRVILQTLDSTQAQSLRNDMSDPIIPKSWR